VAQPVFALVFLTFGVIVVSPAIFVQCFYLWLCFFMVGRRSPRSSSHSESVILDQNYGKDPNTVLQSFDQNCVDFDLDLSDSQSHTNAENASE
jgi:hypothetical protein